MNEEEKGMKLVHKFMMALGSDIDYSEPKIDFDVVNKMLELAIQQTNKQWQKKTERRDKMSHELIQAKEDGRQEERQRIETEINVMIQELDGSHSYRNQQLISVDMRDFAISVLIDLIKQIKGEAK